MPLLVGATNQGDNIALLDGHICFAAGKALRSYDGQHDSFSRASIESE